MVSTTQELKRKTVQVAFLSSDVEVRIEPVRIEEYGRGREETVVRRKGAVCWEKDG